MAICRMCHKIIPDGRDYCDECEHKQKDQADESYLDSLLSSVSLEPGRDDVPVHSDISEAARLSAVRELQAEADSAAEIIASYDVPDDTEVVDTLIIGPSAITPSAEDELMNLGESSASSVAPDDLIPLDPDEEDGLALDDEVFADDSIPEDMNAAEDILSFGEQIPDDILPTDEEITDDGFITLDVTGNDDTGITDDFDIGSIDFDDNTDITKELLNDIITEYEEQHNPERTASSARHAAKPEPDLVTEAADTADTDTELTANPGPEPVYEADITAEPESEPVFEAEPAAEPETEQAPDFDPEIAFDADITAGPEAEADTTAETDPDAETADDTEAELEFAADTPDATDDEPEAEPEFAADTPDATDDEPEAAEGSEPEGIEASDQDFNEDDIAPVIDESLFSLDDEEGSKIDITDEAPPEGSPDDLLADLTADDTGEPEDISDAEASDSEDIPEAEGSPAGDDIDSLLSDITDGELDANELISVGDDEDALPMTDIDDLLTDITDGDIPEAEPIGGDRTSDGNVIDDLLTDITSDGDLGDISLGVDDLFTDAASVDSSIDNLDLGETDISQIMDDIESGEFEKEIDKLMPTAEAQEKPPKSMFDRLFGNIVEDLTPEQLEERRAREEAEEQQRQAALEAKKKRAAESKEEKAKRKEEEKRAKEEAKKAQAEIKKQQKAEAKEKARQRKELLLAEEAAHPDEGRINRLGASILVVLLGAIAVTIILGTSLFTYRLNIKHAQKNFDMQHYNDAYYDVYGLKIHDKDIELYDRIMTVMYVNAQFNAYNNYITLNERELALNALLKGLQRYDKYYQLATILDIRSDYQYVRNMILVELANQFDLTEEEAYNMIDIEEPLDYSETIYELLGSYEVEQQ